MSKEKQIEEMATKMLIEVNRAGNEISFKNLATSLYNAGYRKQSEGEWYKIEGFPRHHFCNQCGKGNRTKSNFCPHCGAKMKGGAE